MERLPAYLSCMTLTVTISDHMTTRSALFAFQGLGSDLPGPFVRRYAGGGEAGLYCGVLCAINEPEKRIRPLPVEQVAAADADACYCASCNRRVV
jgi:hypothetical protein